MLSLCGDLECQEIERYHPCKVIFLDSSFRKGGVIDLKLFFCYYSYSFLKD